MITKKGFVHFEVNELVSYTIISRLDQKTLAKVVKLILWDTKGSLIILLYYGYLYMIEFSKFDDLHGSHSIVIQEWRAYTYMVIIIKKVRNDLLIHVQLGYDMRTQDWLGVIHTPWCPPIVNRDEPRESHLKELRISIVLSLEVKSSICNFTSWDKVKL